MKNSLFSRSLLFAIAGGLLAIPLCAQHPLANRVLVVHNTAYPESETVADFYRAQRGIPVANKCAIDSPNAGGLSVAEWAAVKSTIRNCLTAAGPANILYVVLSYMTPWVYTNGLRGYALDAYIADIWDDYSKVDFFPVPTGQHGYYVETQAEGNHYPAFQSLAAWRAGPKATRLYAVWRLDGPSAAVPQAMVTKAVQTELAGGLSGQACMDRQVSSMLLFADSGVRMGDWDIFKGAEFLSRAGLTVVEDGNEAEFGTAPAPLTCANAALYTGWYSLNNYNDAFTWNPGAIGWHLDSLSAYGIRSGTNWSYNAMVRGITVTSGATEEPFLQGLARSGGVMRNLLEGANVGDAFLRNTRWLKWRVLNLGDPLYTPFPGGRPPFNVAQQENSLQLESRIPNYPRFQVGGRPVTATLRLANPAPAGGLTVALSSSGPVTLPASVLVPAGARQVNFAIGTGIVANSTDSRVYANGTGVSVSNTLITVPLLAGVSVSPNPVQGGQSATGTIQLNDRALWSGASVSLQSSDPGIVQVPATVIISGGAPSATFPVTTTAVGAPVDVVITATLQGASRQVTLRVNP